MMSWKDKLIQSREALLSLQPDPSWADKAALEVAYEKTLASLDRDLEELEVQASFLYSPHAEADNLTDQNIALLKRWYHMGHMPSLYAFCVHALSKFKVTPDEDLLQALAVTSVLASVENDLPYHNVLHYKKVLLQAIRLIAAHNDIYEGSDFFLDDEDIVLVLMAACAHDLAHDGRGNTIKGVYEQARLEKHTLTVLLPYIQVVGFQDKELHDKLVNRFRVMLFCTDTTPNGNPHSFMSQMKAAYRYHFLETKTKTGKLNLDEDIRTLENDAKLTVMALLLHEADMATSSGLSYDVTVFETGLFYREAGQEEARPSGILEFMDAICQRQILSSAGQKLYSANMARIISLAEKAAKAGDHPFVPPEYSDFMLMHKADLDPSKPLN